MKIQIWPVIVGFLLIYFIKKGADLAEKENKTVNIFDALMNGVKHTFEPAPSILRKETGIIDPDDDGYIDYKPSNEKMINFQPNLNSFPKAKLRRNRGMFYVYSIMKDIQASSVGKYDASAN